MVAVWKIYQTLHLTRQVGANGPQPISLSDLHALALMSGYDRTDDFDFLLLAIPALDQEYLKHFYAEQEKANKKKAPAGKPKPPTRQVGRG